jgi:hypothetical protein
MMEANPVSSVPAASSKAKRPKRPLSGSQHHAWPAGSPATKRGRGAPVSVSVPPAWYKAQAAATGRSMLHALSSCTIDPSKRKRPPAWAWAWLKSHTHGVPNAIATTRRRRTPSTST